MSVCMAENTTRRHFIRSILSGPAANWGICILGGTAGSVPARLNGHRIILLRPVARVESVKDGSARPMEGEFAADFAAALLYAARQKIGPAANAIDTEKLERSGRRDLCPFADEWMAHGRGHE